MAKKVKPVEVDVDVVDGKANSILEIIDGLTIPYLFCIIGIVIVKLALSARDNGLDVNDLFVDWLERLKRFVSRIPDNNDVNDIMNFPLFGMDDDTLGN